MKLARMVDFWKLLAKNPEEAFEKEKGAGGLMDAFKIVGLFSMLWALFISCIVFVFGAALALNASIGVMATALPTAVIFLVLFVVSMLGFFVNSGMFYIFAKLLGGKGTYGSQSYLFALLMPLGAVYGIISVLLVMVPCCGSLISMLGALGFLYLYVLAIKACHGLDSVKAVAVVLAPLVIVGILVAVFYFYVIFWNVGMFNPSAAAQASGFAAIRPVAWTFQGAGMGGSNSLYATEATVALNNIAGIDLNVAINGNSASKDWIMKFSKTGAPNCGWYGQVTVEDEVGAHVELTPHGGYNTVLIPANEQIVVEGLLTGPGGATDESNACGGPSEGIYRWNVYFQTALDQHGIQHTDSGSIIGKFQ